MNEKEYMRLAIEKARTGIESGQTPFGACIVKEGRVVSCAHNSVWESNDITAHAEIIAIKVACKELQTVDLTGCTIYSTCEPCPMCFSACYWARISKIVFGARIEDALEFGFSELPISNERMRTLGGATVEIVSDFMRDDCLALFVEWSQRKDKRSY